MSKRSDRKPGLFSNFLGKNGHKDKGNPPPVERKSPPYKDDSTSSQSSSQGTSSESSPKLNGSKGESSTIILSQGSNSSQSVQQKKVYTFSPVHSSSKASASVKSISSKPHSNQDNFSSSQDGSQPDNDPVCHTFLSFQSPRPNNSGLYSTNSTPSITSTSPKQNSSQANTLPPLDNQFRSSQDTNQPDNGLVYYTFNSFQSPKSPNNSGLYSTNSTPSIMSGTKQYFDQTNSSPPSASQNNTPVYYAVNPVQSPRPANTQVATQPISDTTNVTMITTQPVSPLQAAIFQAQSQQEVKRKPVKSKGKKGKKVYDTDSDEENLIFSPEKTSELVGQAFGSIGGALSGVTKVTNIIPTPQNQMHVTLVGDGHNPGTDHDHHE